MHLTEEKIKKLEIKANDIRQSIIEMLVAAGSGHTAGPLGMADIFTLFYFHILRQDPKNPEWPDRDGSRRIFPRGRIENLTKSWFTLARASASRISFHARNFFRSARQRAFAGSRHGARGQTRQWTDDTQIYLLFYVGRRAR